MQTNQYKETAMINICGGTLFRDQHIVIFEIDEDCFGNILELAQYFGWEDPGTDVNNEDERYDIDNLALTYLKEEENVWVFVKDEECNIIQLN